MRVECDPCDLHAPPCSSLVMISCAPLGFVKWMTSSSLKMLTSSMPGMVFTPKRFSTLWSRLSSVVVVLCTAFFFLREHDRVCESPPLHFNPNLLIDAATLLIRCASPADCALASSTDLRERDRCHRHDEGRCKTQSRQSRPRRHAKLTALSPAIFFSFSMSMATPSSAIIDAIRCKAWQRIGPAPHSRNQPVPLMISQRMRGESAERLGIHTCAPQVREREAQKHQWSCERCSTLVPS